MPYIKNEQRNKFSKVFDELAVCTPQDAGELNFLVTVICQRYLHLKGMKYQNINDCIGALEGAQLELYRRIAAPYEDKKIEENGDVKLV
jgi:hypothetical protein